MLTKSGNGSVSENAFSRGRESFLFSILAIILLFSSDARLAFAAMPQSLPWLERTALSDGVNQRQEAIQALSGSPWPGVIDHLLQKSANEDGAKAGVHINYPSFGNHVIDGDVRHWVESLAQAFETHLDLQSAISRSTDAEAEDPEGPFLQDNDLYARLAPDHKPAGNSFELWGDYSVSRPSESAVSITYELWNYTGQPQGNLDILTLNYNLNNGQRLGLVDIFESPDQALELMSAWSRKVLEKRLGNLRRPMLELGTEPLIENFSSLTLVPTGICINFQPLQVAPWEAGIQKVVMPLEELMPASPLLSLWNRQD